MVLCSLTAGMHDTASLIVYSDDRNAPDLIAADTLPRPQRQLPRYLIWRFSSESTSLTLHDVTKFVWKTCGVLSGIFSRGISPLTF